MLCSVIFIGVKPCNTSHLQLDRNQYLSQPGRLLYTHCRHMNAICGQCKSHRIGVYYICQNIGIFISQMKSVHFLLLFDDDCRILKEMLILSPCSPSSFDKFGCTSCCNQDGNKSNRPTFGAKNILDNTSVFLR